jgi:hypothetical protein
VITATYVVISGGTREVLIWKNVHYKTVLVSLMSSHWLSIVDFVPLRCIYIRFDINEKVLLRMRFGEVYQ